MELLTLKGHFSTKKNHEGWKRGTNVRGRGLEEKENGEGERDCEYFITEYVVSLFC